MSLGSKWLRGTSPSSSAHCRSRAAGCPGARAAGPRGSHCQLAVGRPMVGMPAPLISESHDAVDAQDSPPHCLANVSPGADRPAAALARLAVRKVSSYTQRSPLTSAAGSASVAPVRLSPPRGALPGAPPTFAARHRSLDDQGSADRGVQHGGSVAYRGIIILWR